MSRSEKYVDLVGHPGVRVRLERVQGNALVRDAAVWWDRELIAFLAPAMSPYLKELNAAHAKLQEAIRACACADEDPRAEVVLFHGAFVKAQVWCPPGTASKLGIKV